MFAAKVFSHFPADLVPPPLAISDVRAKAIGHVPGGIFPPPRAVNEVSATPMNRVPPVVSVRRRLVNRRKRRPSWGLAIAVSIVGIVLSGLAIKLLRDWKEGSVKDEPPAGGTVQVDQLERETPTRTEEQKQLVEPPPAPPVGKFPVPTPEELAKARHALEINGDLTAKEFLQAGNDCQQPWMRYLLYQMAIDAAVAETNSEIAFRAAEAIIEHYEVDADALRNEVKKKLQPRNPPPAIDAPHPPAFRAVRLPSGRELTEHDLKPLAPDEIRTKFPTDSPIFVLKPDEDRPAEGLFTYRFTAKKTKEFDGPALVVHPNGRRKILLSYANHARHGKLRYWDADGTLVLLSEYKNGNKLGLTSLCEKGRPVLIEELDTSQKPKSYFIEIRAEATEAIPRDGTNESQRRRLDDALTTLHRLESDLFKEEGKWKKSFNKLWDRNASDIKRLQRAVEITPDASHKKHFQKELDELVAKIKSESMDGARKLLGALRPE